MENVLQITHIQQANELVGKETLHPLATVIDFSIEQPMKKESFTMGLFGVFVKAGHEADVKYGRSSYDYQSGTLLAIGPGQMIGFETVQPGETFQPKGWGLMFHPDLLLGTGLNKRIQDFSFFSYSVREALHLSVHERQMILDTFIKIEEELKRPIDKHSKIILVSTIELLLNHCQRYYDRQFISREISNQGILARFEELLASYFSSDLSEKHGFPTVSYFADQLHLSSNYFGDLVKKETGKTALELIQLKIIDLAKERLLDPVKTSTEIAYELGFRYPQHFFRFFKQHVGMTAKDFRKGLD